MTVQEPKVRPSPRNAADRGARPEGAIARDLSLLTKDRNGYQQVEAGREGDSGDDGGHLIATIIERGWREAKHSSNGFKLESLSMEAIGE
ncbi:hypothetical protein [Burkholderia multivorans]|uniref:hypothetical protein n=1 Tax=Burkholderia multivorans TaxID=87883 RepID=UPI001B9E77CD|nr:hypothetical protein [Burkholderia multivorans]MBR8125143.1 hypothetical protein [Burkholderia multivorans]MBU9603984.1 DNA/RNA non-specific endonuclease [Burkholderia multivorans]MBU9663435.1 DNA/RNA non-specific endonuclease [Burkholderia multivorans]MCO8629720.1 hypothetical protein [Burkholderia multivorans]